MSDIKFENFNIHQTLFDKYILFSQTFVIKDCIEADANETEESSDYWKYFLSRLSQSGVFELMANGYVEKANQIIQEELESYTEQNTYYIDLNAKTGIDYYTLRKEECGKILKYDNVSNLSNNDIAVFLENYNTEKDFFAANNVFYLYKEDFLYRALFRYLMVFSTILRSVYKIMNYKIDLNTTDQFILNNYLASHGFLLYNNIPKSKKADFALNIMNLYNEKGSYQVIERIVKIIVGNEATIYDYWLYLEEKEQKYYFLKVKPNENFMNIYLNKKGERRVEFTNVIIWDNTWFATEEDLLNQNVRLIKSKYFSLESSINLLDIETDICLLINKLKLYRNIFKTDYFIEISEFGGKISFLDYIMFISYLAYKVRNFDETTLKNLKCNLVITDETVLPLVFNGKYTKIENKTLKELIEDAFNEKVLYEEKLLELESNKLEYETGSELYNLPEKVKEKYTRYSDIKKFISNNFEDYYQKMIDGNDKQVIYVYEHLSSKNIHFKDLMDEKDLDVTKDNFLRCLEYLQMILSMFNYTYSDFIKPYQTVNKDKIEQIIRYFKSLASDFVDLSTTYDLDENGKRGFKLIDQCAMKSYKNFYDYNSFRQFYFRESGDNSIIYDNKLPTIDGSINNGNNLSGLNTENNPNLVSRGEYDFIQEIAKRLEEIFKNEDFYWFKNYFLDFNGANDEIRQKLLSILKRFPFITSLISSRYKLNITMEKYKTKDFKYKFKRPDYTLIFKEMDYKVTPKDILFVDYNSFIKDDLLFIEKKDGNGNVTYADLSKYRKNSANQYPDYFEDEIPQKWKYNYYSFLNMDFINDICNRVIKERNMNTNLYN